MCYPYLPKVSEVTAPLLFQLGQGLDREDDDDDRSDELTNENEGSQSTKVVVDPQGLQALPDYIGAHLGKLHAQAYEGEKVGARVVQRHLHEDRFGLEVQPLVVVQLFHGLDHHIPSANRTRMRVDSFILCL